NAVTRDATSHTHVTEVTTEVTKQPTSRPVHATAVNYRPRRAPAAAAQSIAKTPCRSARRIKARRPRVTPKRPTAPTASPRTAPSRANTPHRASTQSKAPTVDTQRNVTQRNATWVPEPIRADPRIVAPHVGTPFGGFPR
ncbi:MAG: hypothetical protein KAI47_03930, partial [Deltaproteobacteria bacterium]|nr:hypothetical protein [Deltaproteobacteria bacterium]